MLFAVKPGLEGDKPALVLLKKGSQPSMCIIVTSPRNFVRMCWAPPGMFIPLVWFTA